MQEAIDVIKKEEEKVKCHLAGVYAQLETARALHAEKEQLEEKLLNLQTARNRLQMVLEAEQPEVVNEAVQDTWGDLELVK